MCYGLLGLLSWFGRDDCCSSVRKCEGSPPFRSSDLIGVAFTLSSSQRNHVACERDCGPVFSVPYLANVHFRIEALLYSYQVLFSGCLPKDQCLDQALRSPLHVTRGSDLSPKERFLVLRSCSDPVPLTEASPRHFRASAGETRHVAILSRSAEADLILHGG